MDDDNMTSRSVLKRLAHQTKAKDDTQFKFEVIADSSNTWCGNGMRFDSQDVAEEAARDLFARWMLVKAWRVINTTTGEVVKTQDWRRQ